LELIHSESDDEKAGMLCDVRANNLIIATRGVETPMMTPRDGVPMLPKVNVPAEVTASGML
jgi:hypothetical protein